MNDSIEPEHAMSSPQIFDLPIFDSHYKADPHTTLRGMNTKGEPLLRVRLPSGVLAWLITDYDLARAVLADARFSKQSPRQAQKTLGEESHPVFDHMLQLDPPEHTRLRALVARIFVSQHIKAHSDHIQTRCDQLIDSLTARNEIELVSQFAVPLALSTICYLIGIPESESGQVQHWAERLVKAEFEDPRLFSVIGKESQDYLESLLASPALLSDATVLSQLTLAIQSGDMSRNELFAMVFLLLNAGYETSANFIANAVFALLRSPGTNWSALCSNPSRVPGALEELLRTESPLEMASPRYAGSSVEIAGTHIPRGDLIFVALAAANRDKAHFKEPDDLDITRPNAHRHLAFGHGVHFCLGAQLARLQGQIALHSLTLRLPRLALDLGKEASVWQPGLIMRGLSHLHLIHRC